ncbi:MAG: polysaccharide biosynthesis C-terminal domain-containing protein [Fibrobacteria bacterium]
MAARLFGVQAWGQYIFLNAFFTPVLRLAAAGMDKGVVWFISRHAEQRIDPGFFRTLRNRMLAFCTVLLFGIAAYRLFVAETGRQTSGLIEPISLTLMGLAVPFMILTNLNLGVSIAFKKVEHDVLVRGIAYPALQLGLPCLLAIWSRNIQVLAAAFLIGCIAGYWLSQALSAPLKRRLAENPIGDAEVSEKAFRGLWNYSWPMGLRDLVLAVQSRIDIWCLALFLDPKSLGVYGLALSIANSVKTVRQSFDNILLVVISRLKRNVDSLEIKKAYLHAGELIIALQMPIFAFLTFFAPHLLKLSGEAFEAGKGVLLVFALTLILNSYLGLSGMVVMGLGKSRWALNNDILGLVLVVIFNLILVPRYGILGAAFATSASLVTVSLVWFYEATYLIRRVPLNASVVVNFLSGVGAVGVFYYLWSRFGQETLYSRATYFSAFAVLYALVFLFRFRHALRFPKSLPFFKRQTSHPEKDPEP